nr:MAG TPA: hypothetical protein [Herelleviridae sp.]
MYLESGAQQPLPPKSPQSHPVFIHHDVDCSYTLRAYAHKGYTLSNLKTGLFLSTVVTP